MDISQERLRELLFYNPLSGSFTWRAKSSPFSRANLGAIAGFINYGYRVIKVGGKAYQAHRLAWLYMTGEWPKAEIDHINLNRADNRFNNLREATRSQNFANRRVMPDSVSGLKGASWRAGRRRNVWRSILTHNGDRHYLGSFDCPAAAHFAYVVASELAFGEFARRA